MTALATVVNNSTMSWDYIAYTLHDLNAPPGFVESVNYLYQCGDYLGVQACLNAHADNWQESGCRTIDPEVLELAPPAPPERWAMEAAERILARLQIPTTGNALMILARSLEIESEDRYASLARSYHASLRRPDEFLDDSPDWQADPENNDEGS